LPVRFQEKLSDQTTSPNQETITVHKKPALPALSALFALPALSALFALPALSALFALFALFALSALN